MQMRGLLAILVITLLPSCLIAEENTTINNGATATIPETFNQNNGNTLPPTSANTTVAPLPAPVLDRSKVEAECYRAAKEFGLPDSQIAELLGDCVAEGMGQQNPSTASQQSNPDARVDKENSEKLTQLACQESVREHPPKDRQANYKACLQANLPANSPFAAMPLSVPKTGNKAANTVVGNGAPVPSTGGANTNRIPVAPAAGFEDDSF